MTDTPMPMPTYRPLNTIKVVEVEIPQIKPDRNPENRICFRCEKPNAERWDGGDAKSTLVFKGIEQKLPSPIYLCCICDKKHVFYDLREEDY